MEIGSAFNASQAMAQVAQSVQQMNNLTQNIVDSSQSLNNKLVGMNAEAKVQQAQENAIDLMA